MNDMPGTTTKLTVAALIISSFSTMLPGILTGLLLIDLASTFNVPLGIMSQIRSTRSSITMIIAVCMGGLSVRFRHKPLLLLGLLFFSLSAVGCGFAPNVLVLMLFYSLGGVGMALVNPMIRTIVGNRYSLDERSSIVGWLVAGASFSYVVGAPVISTLADLGGWRIAFLGYVLVIPLVGFVLVWRGVPALVTASEPRTQIWAGFKEVFSHRSAVACLVAIIGASVAWQVFVFFSTSLIRDRFLISQNWAAIILSGNALSFTCGSLMSGRVVNRFGRKRLTSVTALFVGMLGMLFVNMPSFWGAVLLTFAGGFFGGIRYAASDNLALEQLPSFRGTMMSLNSVAINLGGVIGSVLGGFLLLLYDWEALGVVLGAFGIAASLIFFSFVTDTVQQDVSTAELRGGER